jgi:uncharacterized protein (TIGR03083 family)
VTWSADSQQRWDALRREGSAFREAVGAAELGSPVPSCPDWTLEQLVAHLGGEHRTAIAAIGGRGAAPDHVDVPPLTGGELLEWWDEGYADLLDLLGSADADAPAWNPYVAARTAGFWFRRQAVETALHRWDAQLAATGLTEPLHRTIAADGVDEVLTVFLPSGRGTGPHDRFGLLRLFPDDIEASWTVRVRGAAVSVLDTHTVLDPGPHPPVEAHGPASDLLLVVWGRIGVDVLTVNGDPALISALRVG